MKICRPMSSSLVVASPGATGVKQSLLRCPGLSTLDQLALEPGSPHPDEQDDMTIMGDHLARYEVIDIRSR